MESDRVTCEKKCIEILIQRRAAYGYKATQFQEFVACNQTCRGFGVESDVIKWYQGK